MPHITRDAILAAEDLPYEDVEVPEWGGTVRVAGMSGKKATDFSAKLVKVNPDGSIQAFDIDNFMAELLVLTLVDEKFKPLFNQDEVKALGEKSAAVLKRLSDIAMRLSGLTETAVKEKAKN